MATSRLACFTQKIKHNFFSDYNVWPHWLPVFMGMGVFFYFSLKFEPSFLDCFFIIGTFLLACICSWKLSKSLPLKIISLLFLMISFGFFCSKLRTSYLATPMLEKVIYRANISGKIVGKDGVWYGRYLRNRITIAVIKNDVLGIKLAKVRLSLRKDLAKKSRNW